jgi:hypothetical protein
VFITARETTTRADRGVGRPPNPFPAPRAPSVQETGPARVDPIFTPRTSRRPRVAPEGTNRDPSDIADVDAMAIDKAMRTARVDRSRRLKCASEAPCGRQKPDSTST